MTATTQARNTPSRGNLLGSRGYPVGAGVKCFAGAIGVINSAGFVVPATTAVGVTAAGRFARSVDNSDGGNGDAQVELQRGYFRYANSASADQITAADIGKRCYLVDDQTVAKTHATNTRSVAGFVDEVDEQGVWVLLDPTSGASA